MMSVEKNLQDLSTDLIIEIFSRLPSKSIVRFRCLSKLWASLLTSGSPYFTELFLTQSITRPRLLFAVQNDNYEWCLYSCPQPQISYKNSTSSLSVTAEFHMSLPKTWILHMSPPISGLIYFSNMQNFNKPRLCNPSLGYMFRLRKLRRVVHSYFGYDPINQQFSVLAISHIGPDQGMPSNYQILKLGSERVSRKNIECPLYHYPLQANICINGVLYYFAHFEDVKLVCFDLNSEKFNFVVAPFLREPDRLVNFKGKLGAINMRWVKLSKKKYNLELSLWVLEDTKKQDWSKHVYLLPSKGLNTKLGDISIVGVTATSKVVLSLRSTTNPLYVYFFNLEKNRLEKVQVNGFEASEDNCFYGCVEYVEELRVVKGS